MKNVSVALVRLLQFLVFVVFTFMVLVYFGALILLPLDAVVLVMKLLSVFGVSNFVGALIAIPVVAYICYSVYKIPKLSAMLLEIGMDMVNTGKMRVEAFNELAEEVKA
jgi:hypothetical protein